MATVAVRIARAMRLINQIGSGEDPTSDEYADGLIALNAMLDAWRNEKLLCYAYQEQTVTMVAADSSYTIGPSGDLVTTRPVEIAEAYIVSGNISYPVTMRDESWWAAIPDKTATAEFPTDALFRPGMENATVSVYPVPTATSSLKLITRVAVTAFASTATTVTLPPGWEAAIDFNLALELAPEYEAVPSGYLVKRANEALAGIKKANIKAQRQSVETDLTGLFVRTPTNIFSG